MQWYAVRCKLGHQGAGKSLEITNYVYAEDAAVAYKLYKQMPGVKKSRNPNIHPLTDSEATNLEQKIAETLNINIEQARKKGVYGQDLEG